MFLFQLILLLCFSFVTSCISQSLLPKVILENMFKSIDNVQTLRFKLKKQERVDNVMKSGEQDVKFNKTPKKVYTYIQAPNKGVEVLFLEGKNNNHAYVNPNAFPYINVHLDPMGSVMRKGNHHTVNEVGFDYIKGIVNNIADKSVEDFDKIFLTDEEVEFNGKSCYKIIIDYYPFKIIPYIVQEGESLTTIAYKNFLSDFMILELNKAKVDNYQDVKAGQEILIPTGYARKTILYIDKQTFLPLVQIMYDDKGLFEQYEFYNVILNSKINDEEFSSDNEKYGF